MAFNNIPPNGFPQIPDIEDLEAVVKDVTTLKAAKAAKTDIAPTFSATSIYAVGDLVYYNGALYVCTTAHEAAAWNAEHFTATSVASELVRVENGISDLNDTKANQITIAPFFNPEASYEVGDLVYYNGLSYRCTNDHEGAWDADDFAATTIAGELGELKSGLTSLDFGKMQYDGTSVDINTVLTNGWHYGSSTGSGLDGVDDYYMLVFHLGNYIKQFVIGKFGYGKKLYMRYSGDGGTTWSVSKVEFTDVT